MGSRDTEAPSRALAQILFRDKLPRESLIWQNLNLQRHIFLRTSSYNLWSFLVNEKTSYFILASKAETNPGNFAHHRNVLRLHHSLAREG